MPDDLHNLLLTEEYTADPTRPGYRLTWRETRGQATRDRTGLVESAGPVENTVWVVPDDRQRRGEGQRVIVYGVTPASAADARRTVGCPADAYSTRGWQQPTRLPRAVLRVDEIRTGDTRLQVALLHAAGTCRQGWYTANETRTVGQPVVVRSCYVFGGRFLHPWSRRPVNPVHRDRYADLCLCLTGHLPGQP